MKRNFIIPLLLLSASIAVILNTNNENNDISSQELYSKDSVVGSSEIGFTENNDISPDDKQQISRILVESDDAMKFEGISVDVIWDRMTESEFGSEDIERLIHEFFGKGGGMIFREEIISMFREKRFHADIATDMFTGLVYSEPWTHDKGINGVDSVIKEFIQEQMFDPYNKDILFEAIWNSYMITSGHDRYLLVEQALENHPELLNPQDTYRLRLITASLTPDLLVNNLSDMNSLSIEEQGLYKDVIFNEIRVLDKTEEVKKLLHTYVNNNTFALDDGNLFLEDGNTHVTSQEEAFSDADRFSYKINAIIAIEDKPMEDSASVVLDIASKTNIVLEKLVALKYLKHMEDEYKNEIGIGLNIDRSKVLEIENEVLSSIENRPIDSAYRYLLDGI